MVDRDRIDADPDLARIWEFTDLVAASSRSARQRERIQRAAELPVPPASLLLLRVIARHAPQTAGQVARHLGLDQSTTSRQLRPLEEHRLIERQIDPADRRAAPLWITPAGEALLARARSVALNDFDVALRSWSATDRSTLADLLDRFRSDLLATRADTSGWSV